MKRLAMTAIIRIKSLADLAFFGRHLPFSGTQSGAEGKSYRLKPFMRAYCVGGTPLCALNARTKLGKFA